jgi:hypothetical protein
MKKKLKQYKLFFYLILFSCNPNSIDQSNPLNLRDIDIIGKYWFNIFQTDNQQAFDEYLIKGLYDGIYGDINFSTTQKIHGEKFPWEKMEYLKCITNTNKDTSEFYLGIYFKNTSNNQNFRIGLIFTKELTTNKYFFKPQYDTRFKFTKNYDVTPPYIVELPD